MRWEFIQVGNPCSWFSEYDSGGCQYALTFGSHVGVIGVAGYGITNESCGTDAKKFLFYCQFYS